MSALRPLFIIPVRAGSKGVPRKNVREMAGFPLYAHALLLVHRLGEQRVCVTTDDPLVAETNLSATVIDRPPALAADDTPMLPVVQHAAKAFSALGGPSDLWWDNWDVAVLLQPTSPLRRAEHIRAALKLLEKTGADSVVSVVEVPAKYAPERLIHYNNPGFMMPGPTLSPVVPRGDWVGRESGLQVHVSGLDAIPRRQSCSRSYVLDGTVYATRRATLEAGSLYGANSIPLIIPPHDSCSIDTEEDWARAESIMKERR